MPQLNALLRISADNNVMHTKPDLRVFEMDDLSFRLGDHGRYVA